ncbi:ABC transporter permease [Pelotomaculum terephthalicicum JT]|uniref:ABC transporter permease n=1 Tax=Pelotomaculum TaxID=191373 RepID=UPI0009C5C1B0|nr:MULTISPECIES: ABC transporter permease [Pelotomaculum]MCG9969893.1 ABC transporter permease [Pelotomaculum terephthalicicum JT]OPX86877.1 MAG: macrolide transporter ATP-binding /permease protein [Pelotomaculum sp. PtaB.Bin117]
MKNYLSLVPKYLSAHAKKTRLTIAGVAVSVALITGIFSMLDVFMQFEKIQVIHDYGNYHLLLKEPSGRETHAIASRIDVENAGGWKDLGEASINGVMCKLGALEQNFAENLNIRVIEGEYPTAENEIMLEQWAAENNQWNLKTGDAVKIAFADGAAREFIISGIFNDLGGMKAKGVPGVLLSVGGAAAVHYAKTDFYFIKFKSGVNILAAEKEIKSALNIADDRIERNERLLAVMGQSGHNAATDFYKIGAILFFMVLVAGVIMIYNTFNISVMDRVRQFGLLRCIGASQAQIKKLVRREGIYITLRAIPGGLLAGMLITFICSGILKFYNSSLFGAIPLFNCSLPGLAAGIGAGFLTVFIASFVPARKAARVSPVSAAAGGNQVISKKREKRSFLTKTLPVEIAMGVNNAVLKKKTLFLMSSSIAVSIIIYFGFNVFVDFMHTSLKTTKPNTPDISLTSEHDLEHDLYARLSGIDGVKKVYGRMFGYVDATFDAARLTGSYQENMGGIKVKDNGLFVPPESAWLISYDQNQLNWAKADLIAGELSEDKINEQNGVIAVAMHLRKGVSTETANLKLGDKVYIETPAGTKELKVMGILRTVPFDSKELTLTTFITTEKLFTELTGGSAYKIIDIQLDRRNQEQAFQAIKSLAGNSITVLDARQKNAEIDQTFLTMAVFIYGFIAVIALISILNIINTMNTSVASKTRYLGVMRAVGMSNAQLSKMVLCEAATYSLTGCLAGCVLGIMLQKALVANWLSTFHIIWQFPIAEVVLIFILTMLITFFSIISPLRRIKAKSVSEVVHWL